MVIMFRDKDRKKEMKNILAIGAVCTMMSLTLVGCGKDEQKTNCLNDLKIGLQNRWDLADQDYSSFEENQGKTLKGIDEELKELEEYKNIEFKDEAFGKTINEYINALESQKEGISYVFTNADKYNELFHEKGRNIRIDCLNQLIDEYNFNVDPEYENSLEDLVNDDCEYSLIEQNDKVEFDTEYGEVGVSFIGFDIMTNPADEKELVLLCELENISYEDEYNGEMLFIDYFMTLSDGEGYRIHPKNTCYDYIEGYEESTGSVFLNKGEKSRFAIMFDYIDEIDTIYAVVGGEEQTYECYIKRI